MTIRFAKFVYHMPTADRASSPLGLKCNSWFIPFFRAGFDIASGLPGMVCLLPHVTLSVTTRLDIVQC